jgi:hypothetical protein
MRGSTHHGQLSEDQLVAVRRAVGLMVTWQASGDSPEQYELHRQHLDDLLREDLQDDEFGRLVSGMVVLSGQLLNLAADVTNVPEPDLLRAVAEMFAEIGPV